MTYSSHFPLVKLLPVVVCNVLILGLFHPFADLTNLTTLLLPVGNKWNQLGKELGLCDITLGIIRNKSYGYLLSMSEWYYFCLKEVLTIWLKKNLPKDELAEALIKIGEENLARSICMWT